MDNPEIDDDGDDYSPNGVDELSESGDDEETMEEEENLQNDDDDEDEIAALQQEQDLPIEDLIKLYGYANSSLNNDKAEEELDKSANNPDDEKANISEQIRKYFNDTDESDADDDYIPNESWKKEIRVGPDYQAFVPENSDESSLNLPQPDAEGELIWHPDTLEDRMIIEYLTNFYRLEHGDAKPENVVQIPDDETALKTFFENKYDQNKALNLIKNIVNGNGNKINDRTSWTDEEATIFENGLKVYGKNFSAIQKNLLTQKTVPELVRYYYYWKKTERHDEFVRSFHFEKRHFNLHPSATDYADIFLDNLPGVNVAHHQVLLPELASSTSVVSKHCGMMAGERKNHQINSTHYNLWNDIDKAEDLHENHVDDRHENHVDCLPCVVVEPKKETVSDVVDDLPNL